MCVQVRVCILIVKTFSNTAEPREQGTGRQTTVSVVNTPEKKIIKKNSTDRPVETAKCAPGPWSMLTIHLEALVADRLAVPDGSRLV